MLLLHGAITGKDVDEDTCADKCDEFILFADELTSEFFSVQPSL